MPGKLLIQHFIQSFLENSRIHYTFYLGGKGENTSAHTQIYKFKVGRVGVQNDQDENPVHVKEKATT